ncbi:MAG TPA: LLM class flavin-dependent oxidoreductase [Iamia sp.]|jgi:alkanesulfonate monooxygenase SsuD/methylene tetrahydromethanopterin reductase-like flavin-dependent oxidoreductase (luciferase family)|nr:LLM class flavin-dependent oxidoreductase [Iamia sp.]
MDVGMALPTMAPGYGPGTTVDWSRGIDAGPFSSVSAGERITFDNPEIATTLAAAAAVTERVEVIANIWILPMHPPALVAKQVATLDHLAGGRFTLGVGVGGRGHDYRAAAAPYERRHARLDECVAEVRRLLAGEPPFAGADPVGPPPVREGGVPILASPMGPRSMARAAAWADGITGFSVAGRGDEMRRTNELADTVFAAADRPPPRKLSGCFYVVGVDDPLATLRAFATRYLAIFGEAFAAAMAAECWVASPDDLRQLLDDAEAAGVDELVLVPGTVDRACLDATAEVVAAR